MCIRDRFFQDGNSRQQSQTYTIDSADTWEKKTITIDGDTSGSLQMIIHLNLHFTGGLLLGLIIVAEH